MHPRNPYASRRPDFAALAGEYPVLAPFVTVSNGEANIDFSDANALRALTTTLLKHDFCLDVEIREDRLCPTVANRGLLSDYRLDYVLLCLDLAAHATPGRIRAMDIGTGHLAIYALLLHRQQPDAYTIASELDETSLEHAKGTVRRNSIPETAISVRPPPADQSLLGHLHSEEQKFTFTLCNPPFFASASEAAASRELKAAPAPAAPTCSTNEEITRGGEEAFVGQMIDESSALRDRCTWFTSLIGRYSSLAPLVERVKALTDNYYVVQLRQARTTRWVLIWGWSAWRLPDSITRPAHLDPRTSFAHLLPLPNSFTCPPSARAPEEVRQSVLAVLKEVGLLPDFLNWDGGGAASAANPSEEGRIVVHLVPTSNTWSRAARRAAQRESQPVGESNATAGVNATSTDVPDEPLFRATIVLDATAVLEWTWGPDRAVVDAFWKFLVRKAGLLELGQKRPREGELGEAPQPVRGRGRSRGRGERGRGRSRGFRGESDAGWPSRAQ